MAVACCAEDAAAPIAAYAMRHCSEVRRPSEAFLRSYISGQGMDTGYYDEEVYYGEEPPSFQRWLAEESEGLSKELVCETLCTLYAILRTARLDFPGMTAMKELSVEFARDLGCALTGEERALEDPGAVPALMRSLFYKADVRYYEAHGDDVGDLADVQLTAEERVRLFNVMGADGDGRGGMLGAFAVLYKCMHHV